VVECESIKTAGDEFDGMDRNALKKYIKENGLEVKVFKSDSDDDIRAKIRAAAAPAAEEAPEAEEEKPAAKKAPAKKAEKPAKKAEKAEKKPTAKRGVKLDPQNNEEDMNTLKAALTDLFPEDEFKYDAVKSAGVTIKHKGQNSNRALVLIENCSLQADGSIKCNLYFLTLAKNLEVLDNADIAYEKCWSGAPFIKGTTLAEAVEAIGAVKEHLTAQVKKIDKRLGENRAKMEEGLAKKSAAKAAPAEKKAEKPAKKTTKK
jgi:septum formation inhibitor MinC